MPFDAVKPKETPMEHSKSTTLRLARRSTNDCPSLAGLEVRELDWDASGWDQLVAPLEPVAEKLFPTLVNWRVSFTGDLEGQLLHYPGLPYAAPHKTDAIVEVRKLDHVRVPVAFAADGCVYRLSAPSVEHNCRERAAEWLEMMLAEDSTLPPLTRAPQRGERDVFGLHTPA